MNKRAFLSIGTLAIANGLIATACAPAQRAAPAPGAAGETIKIVSSLPRTGADKGKTDSMVNAMKMALDEVNSTVGKFTIKYEDWDDATATAQKWDPAQETENANKAAADQDIMAYLGTFNSGAAKLSIPILNRADPGPLVMISPGNTWPGLTKKVALAEPGEPDKYYPTGDRSYARVLPTDEIQAPAGARWAKQLGASKVFILDDQETYGKGIADLFEADAKKLSLQVLGHEGINAKAADYKALMAKIKGLNSDLIYFGGITANGAGQLVKDKVGAGMPNGQVKIMVPDGCYENAFIEAAGKDNAEGVYATFGGVSPDKYTGKPKEWAEAYKKKFSDDPDAYAIYAYEAMKVALDAIERAGKKDRRAIRDQVFLTTNFSNGVLGTWSFTETGDTTITDMAGAQVKGGKWVGVAVLTAT